MSLQIQASDLNFLIYRYFQENGLTHTAYTLSIEAGISEESFIKKGVLPGALLTLVEKGLMMKYIETHLETSVRFSFNSIHGTI